MALTVLIIGFNFLKGKDLFNRSKKIYAVFKQLGSLDKANVVKMNGVQIGKVYEIEPVNRTIDSVKVTISLSLDVDIPANSIAYISPGFVGSSTLIIEKGNATTYLLDGDELKTRREANAIQDISSEVSPTLVKLRESMDSLNRVLENINKLFNSEAKNNLQQTIANLKTATGSLDKLVDPENSHLATVLKNAGSITDNLKKNNDTINGVLSNAKTLTGKLAKLELQQTIDSLESVMTLLKATVAKMTSPNGSLGAMMNDKQLFNNINDLSLSLQTLTDDIRVHPKRYFGNLIFNRKDKTGPLTSPTKKDSIP